MAKGKDSFVLYSNWVDTFDRLSDEQAGKFIKHIFHYVNDKNPVLKNKMLSILFEPMKHQLKRDLKKWEKSRKSKSEGGKKGMKSRWGNGSKGITEDNLVKDDITPITVPVSVSVNVPVNDNVTVKKERKGFAPPAKEDVVELMFEKLDEFSAMGEADKFINFYQSKNWYVGKTKMKDWRAAARGWITRINDFKNSNNGSSKTNASVKTAGAHELLDKIRASAGGK